MKAEPLLELIGVTKTYRAPAPVHALREIDLVVARGELVAVVGPSGSGKTTLLHIAGTLDRPSTGSVRVAGYDVGALADRQLAALRARRIGFVFQQFFLAENQTVLDNVADGLLYAGAGLAARRQLAASALGRVGLSGRADFRPGRLSGGERQRVAIARALVGEREIILADEPTGNLDTATSGEILKLLRALNDDGATIVVVTHNHDLASGMRRRVDMCDGRIVGGTAGDALCALAGPRWEAAQ